MTTSINPASASATARALRLAEKVELDGATFFKVANVALAQDDTRGLFTALEIQGDTYWVLTPDGIAAREALLMA